MSSYPSTEIDKQKVESKIGPCACGNSECKNFSGLNVSPVTRLDPVLRRDILDLIDGAMNVTSEKEFDEVDKKSIMIRQREVDAGLIEWNPPGIIVRELVKLHEVDKSIRSTLDEAVCTAAWYTVYTDNDKIHLQKAKEHGLVL